MKLSLTGFQYALAAALLALFVVLLVFVPETGKQADTPTTTTAEGTLQVFTHPQCPHCHEALDFLERNADRFPAIEKIDVTSPSGQRRLEETAARVGLPLDQLAVPLFVYNGKWRIGFDRDETTGQELIEWVGKGLATDGNYEPATRGKLVLPLIGEIDPARTSLPALTVLLGIADGFNPCAMWVLVYLISIIAGLKDRSKIWWLVGTFVLASGLLYFLFMTAWLNTFLIIGYARPLTLMIALVAIGLGINNFYELYRTRGVVECQVGDIGDRQRTMARIRSAVAAPIGLASIVGMFALALAVNAIEFACSAALPAVYTHTLSLMALSPLAHYGYIALYVLFFMADDLIIFGLAAFAVEKVLDSRYAAYSRFVGAVLLVALGVWMLIGQPGFV